MTDPSAACPEMLDKIASVQEQPFCGMQVTSGVIPHLYLGYHALHLQHVKSGATLCPKMAEERKALDICPECT